MSLIPEWEYTAYALDFTAYSVGEAHTYPRFLCYDCHGFRPYQSWNPYHYTCTSFRLMIWDDPFYYPYSRYRGTRVVYVQPQRPREPRFVFKERADGEPGVPVVRTRPGNIPVADRPGVAGDPAPRRTVPGGGVSSGNLVRQYGCTQTHICRTQSSRWHCRRRSANESDSRAGDVARHGDAHPSRAGAPSRHNREGWDDDTTLDQGEAEADRWHGRRGE